MASVGRAVRACGSPKVVTDFFRRESTAPFRVSAMAVIHGPVLLARVAWLLAAGVASASKLVSVPQALKKSGTNK